MTAAFRDALAVVPDTSRFFDALLGADSELAHRDTTESAAMFAPQITTIASCVCGSVLEIRDNHIRLTGEETTAAAELAGLDASIVARVIDAINHQRTTEDHNALHDWQDTHTYCEDHNQ